MSDLVYMYNNADNILEKFIYSFAPGTMGETEAAIHTMIACAGIATGVAWGILGMIGAAPFALGVIGLSVGAYSIYLLCASGLLRSKGLTYMTYLAGAIGTIAAGVSGALLSPLVAGAVIVI